MIIQTYPEEVTRSRKRFPESKKVWGRVIFNKHLEAVYLWWNSDTGSHLDHVVDITLFGIKEQMCCAPLI